MNVPVTRAYIVAACVLVFTLIQCGSQKTSSTSPEDTALTANETQYATITGTGVNARKGPGIGYGVEFQVGKDERVKVLEISYPQSADTAFVEYEWVDSGQGNFVPPCKFSDAVMTDVYKIDDEVTLSKGMAVRVSFSSDPGGHGWVHAEYVVEGKRCTLKLHDAAMITFRNKVKPLGAVPWYKIETQSGQKGWVYGEYVNAR